MGNCDSRIRKPLKWERLIITQVWSIMEELRDRRKIIFHLLVANASIPSHCWQAKTLTQHCPVTLPWWSESSLSSVNPHPHACPSVCQPCTSQPCQSACELPKSLSALCCIALQRLLYNVHVSYTPLASFSGSMPIQRRKFISAKII